MIDYFEMPHRRQIAVVLLALLLLAVLFLLLGTLAPNPQISNPRLAGLDSNAAKQTEPQQKESTHKLVIELFYRSDSKRSLSAKQYLTKLNEQHAGLTIKFQDVLHDRKQLGRLWKLSKEFKMEKPMVPTFYLCGRMVVGFDDAESMELRVKEFLTIEAYVRPSCKHCQAGKIFLDGLAKRWPALSVEYKNVEADATARTEVQELAKKFKVQIPSFPCIKVAGRLVIGFQSAEITGARIEAMFQDRSVDFSETKAKTNNGELQSDDKKANNESNQAASLKSSVSESQFLCSSSQPFHLLCAEDTIRPGLKFKIDTKQPIQDDKKDNEEDEEFQLPEEFALPDEADEVSEPTTENSLIEEGEKDEIEVPWLGRLSVSEMGLPAFTFAIGLVDGFNPCAMWVLIFLLSVLVSIKERKKILMVAGTFVVVSGLAYFVFMAAWFNIFQLIGVVRPVQIVLGITAILIGSINIKDFFAFHKGITLSIPESAKPGIYRRVREIVKTNHMTTALSGAVVLAIIVNIVELLCTAGLPALYTEVLTMQQLPTWKNYSYLALYISAYMLDDAILVLIVVCTLSNRRLQESEGRWLKLLSGLVIFTLGVVMIFWPQVLI